MNTNQKGFASVILIIALVAILVGGVGYFTFVQKSSAPVSSCNIETDNYSVVTDQKVSIRWGYSKGNKAYDIIGESINVRGGYGEYGGQTVSFSKPGTYIYTATAHGANSSTKTCSMTITVSQAHATPPREITPVNFDWQQENIYNVRAENAVKILKDAYTDNEYLIHVFSITGDVIAVEVRPLSGERSTQELIMRRNEIGHFLGCPGFQVTPITITNDTVTLSVKLTVCVL